MMSKNCVHKNTFGKFFIGLFVGGLLGLALPPGAGQAVASVMPESVIATNGKVQSVEEAGASESFMARAQEHIAKREYWASESASGLQAPNRQHNFRGYFSSDGIRIVDRERLESAQLMELNYSGVYRGAEQVLAVEEGKISYTKNRVYIDRGEIIEWYVNTAQGLEQGFDIGHRPAGEGALSVVLNFQGAALSQSGNNLNIWAATGRGFNYGKLVVLDAHQAVIPSRFKLIDKQTVALVVDDDNATYPLRIDPLLSASHDRLLEIDQAGASFGFSVASAGDVNGDGYSDVIVGAYQYDSGQTNEGAAFVFHGSATGIAGTPEAQLESDQSSVNWGWSVASAGDVNGDGYGDVIIGAYLYDNGESDEGAAFIFHGGAGGVGDGTPANADAQLESDQASAYLGISVVSAGDVNGDGYSDVIVGANNYDNGQNNEGAAFIFHGGAGGVGNGTPGNADAQLESNQDVALLGISVASAGDVNGDGYDDVIVGANHFDNGQTDEGAVFIFHGGAGGVGNGTPGNADAQIESNQASALMGISVASAGDVNGDGYGDVIVGAYQYDNGQTNEGGAFVFHGGASGIGDGTPANADAQIESDQSYASLGYSVASAGDVNGDGYSDVIVGAHNYDNGQNNEGAAFIFHGGAGGVGDGTPTNADAQLELDQADAWLGRSVASAGDVNGDGYSDLIVGAYKYEQNGETDEGAAFVFHGGASGIGDGTPTNVDAQLESDQTDANLGFSVASAGDVNGDGYGDVIVGAYLYDNGEIDEGAAFVFHGGTGGVGSGTPANASAQLESNQAGARLGASVASAGDVNGDGYGDVIVGSYLYDNGERYEGAAFVFHGGISGVGNGTPANADAQLESDQVDASLGFSVASAGDVNGDGYGDVIVGAYFYGNGENYEGAAFVFHGGTGGVGSGTPANADAQLESDQVDARLGWSVASAGDVNGDGYGDVIVGAFLYDSGQTDEGAAFVFHGGASGVGDGTPANADAQLESGQVVAWLGSSVASAGDVNGDGYSDVIVGANLYDNGQIDEGAAFVFHGGFNGVGNGAPGNADALLESDQASASMGFSVASAGDVNGDGYSDVIVGARLYDNGQLDEGAAFVFHGGISGVGNGTPANADARLESDQVDARMGSSVASAGDVNADGYGDVIVGAYQFDNGQTNEGAAFVFQGNSDGQLVNAHQRRGDGSLPVQPWGLSHNQFQVRLNATHPAGRGRVKLQVEVCLTGVAFGDAGCTVQTAPTWTDVTATPGGISLTETLSGLSSGNLYRWRARVLYAPYSVTQSGITAPPNPPHGPWRRQSAQAVEADVRVVTPPPKVSNINSNSNSGDGTVAEGEIVVVAVTELLVSFDQAVVDPVGSSAANDVTNPANYLLVEAGTNASFDTLSCTGGTVADDTQIAINSAAYNAGTQTTTLSLNGGAALNNGSYQLLVCGSTSIENGAGDKLDGNGDGVGGDDFARSFLVAKSGISITPTSGLTTTEMGGTADFTVRLNTLPTADVTIPLNSSDTGECSVPGSVVVPIANWNTGVSVTVTGVNDAVDDGDQVCTIQTGTSISSDGNYAGINPSDVMVTNQDDDTDTDGDGLLDGSDDCPNGATGWTSNAVTDNDADGCRDSDEDTDDDNDGMPDAYETVNGLDPLVNDAAGDADGDGLSNIQEYNAGSNPQNPDSDSDGIPDGVDRNVLTPTSVFADINGDNIVDSLDLGILMSHWGQSTVWVDLNNSGVVDQSDLLLLRGAMTP